MTQLRLLLLDWYEANRRQLPWRASRDPYCIWVSEIMLQQTRVAVVMDRYAEFLTRFPSVEALAAASEQDVLALWSGLGYYRRARFLHKAAQFVAEELNGEMPQKAAQLLQLPGIGDYTAAAIASIAHGEPVAVVDGNVERVVCRLAGWAVEAQRTAEFKRQVSGYAQRLLDPKHAGDFNQAMMELGATVCTPRSPSCLVCPIRAGCATQGEHLSAPRPKMVSREVGYALAVRTNPAAKCRKHAQHSGCDEVLLEQRPASETVMTGMWQLPELIDLAVPEAELRMTVRHAIMQVNYTVRIRDVGESAVDAATQMGGERRWVPLSEAGTMALTGLARKVLARAHLLTKPRA